MHELHAARRRPNVAARLTAGLCLGGLLVAAGAVAMVRPDDTPPPIQQLVSDVLKVQLNAAQIPAAQPGNEETFVSETRIESGDTVADILERLGVREEGLMTFVTVNKDARSAYRLFPGRSVQAGLDASGSMRWIRYFHTPGTENGGNHVTQFLEILKTGEGEFIAQEVAEQTQSQTHVAFGSIESSLFAATDSAGIPDGITMQMAEILGGRIDFIRDLRKGDSFRVIYETRYHEGRPAGAGRVLAVEFVNKDKKFEAFWFASESGSGGYYDSQGKSLKGAFLRNAIPFTRVSSTFGMRKHPIHNSWRKHNGIDFAAPTGTPIQATGDGVVEFVGRKGGYGNTIVLRHPNNITTLYAHQSRFAKGLKKGDRVSQGEVIGYVGSTGWSTGPHLHYEFLVNGKPVDPLGVKLPESVALDASEQQKYLQMVTPLREQIERMAILQQEVPDLLKVAAR